VLKRKNVGAHIDDFSLLRTYISTFAAVTPWLRLRLWTWSSGFDSCLFCLARTYAGGFKHMAMRLLYWINIDKKVNGSQW